MKNAIMALAITFVTTVSWGYADRGTEKTQNVGKELSKASKNGLVSSRTENRTKREFEATKKKAPLKFDEMIADRLSNTDEYQGWLLEVRDGKSKVEKAKSIAKQKLFEVVEKRWSDLKNTTLNENTDDDFKTFKSALRYKLNGMIYRSQTRENRYVFIVDESGVGTWATAFVSPDLKTVEWSIEVNGMYDGNKLAAGMEKVTVPIENDTASAPKEDDFSY
ncbi:MAG: hypothetical protein KDD25_08555 [Bdellovibrionales bacterium]|nr:hypothetical protein [Bdellovibrionales bacterium]